MLVVIFPTRNRKENAEIEKYLDPVLELRILSPFYMMWCVRNGPKDPFKEIGTVRNSKDNLSSADQGIINLDKNIKT